MHARAARGADGEERLAVFERPLDGAGDLLADDRAHAGAHEAEVGHGQAERRPVDGAGAADDRLVQAGLVLGLDELVLVALAGADEPERVAGSQAAIFFLEGALVEQLRDPLGGWQPGVVLALLADAQVLLELAGVDQLFAAVVAAADPEVRRDVALADPGARREARPRAAEERAATPASWSRGAAGVASAPGSPGVEPSSRCSRRKRSRIGTMALAYCSVLVLARRARGARRWRTGVPAEAPTRD